MKRTKRRIESEQTEFEGEEGRTGIRERKRAIVPRVGRDGTFTKGSMAVQVLIGIEARGKIIII